MAAPMPPLVSVIMPTRGRPELIRVAIQSVLAQTHEHWELIIINDGGPDIGGVVTEHNTSGRIVYLSLPRPRGAAGARNAGLNVARGTYVAYLDDDDWFDEAHLELMLGALEGGGHLVAYSDSRRVVEVEENGRFRPRAVQEPYYATPFSRDALLVNNYIPILSVVHRRDFLESVGGFDESLEVLEDWELWIRMSRKVDFVRVPQVTGSVRWRQDGSTTTTGRRRDHFPCARRIHARYAAQVGERGDLLSARRALLGCLEPAYRDTPPTCSIIVASHDQEDALASCIEGIATATRGVSYEVIVVDHGSADGTVPMLMDGDIDVKLLVLPNAVPVGEALQRGAEAATGRFLVFMPPGAVPKEFWLRALLEDIELHDRVAAICAKLLDVCGTVADAGCDGALAPEDANKHITPRHVGARAWDLVVSSRRVVDLASQVCLIRREVFDRIGGLDTTLETMQAVRELSGRARAHGEIVFQPASVLYLTAQDPADAVARDTSRLTSSPLSPETSASRITELQQTAREAMHAGDLEAADERVAELARLAPDAPATWLTRGVLDLQRGDTEHALASFARAVEQGAEGPRASLGVAMALSAAKRDVEAWEVLSTLVTQHPDASEVAHMLFRVGVNLERWTQLVPPLERYLQQASNDHAIRFATASVCLRGGDRHRAQRHYALLEQNEPTFDGLPDLARELNAPQRIHP